ncbi:hypothetical protein ATANTOWER_010275, partial [Ataeniobius toweri]|nr:hypothetical protein [Ataeniobius toweri]
VLFHKCTYTSQDLGSLEPLPPSSKPTWVLTCFQSHPLQHLSSQLKICLSALLRSPPLKFENNIALQSQDTARHLPHPLISRTMQTSLNHPSLISENRFSSGFCMWVRKLSSTMEF